MTRKESPSRFSVLITSATRSTLGTYLGKFAGSSTKSNTFSIGASTVALLCISAIVSPPSRTLRYALHQRTTPCAGCPTLIMALSQLAGGHCGNSRQVPDRGVDPRRRELDVLQFACEEKRPIANNSWSAPSRGVYSSARTQTANSDARRM